MCSDGCKRDRAAIIGFAFNCSMLRPVGKLRATCRKSENLIVAAFHVPYTFSFVGCISGVYIMRPLMLEVEQKTDVISNSSSKNFQQDSPFYNKFCSFEIILLLSFHNLLELFNITSCYYILQLFLIIWIKGNNFLHGLPYIFFDT